MHNKSMLTRVYKTVLPIVLIAVLLMPAAGAAAAEGDSYQYDGYVYDSWGVCQPSPSMFELELIIDGTSMPDYALSSIEDACTSADGRIFLADRSEGRVNVFDSDGMFLKTLKILRSADTGKIAIADDGSQIGFKAPSGLYYHEKNNELYVADSTTKQVFILDGETYALKRTVDQPDNLSGDTEYAPYKVTVDSADRIYIIVKSSHEGMIELNSDGTFSRYFGVNEPSVNLVQYFWKSIATDVQKEKMGKLYAPAFTNMTMDSEGFVYAVTNDSSASASVFRLNSSGENVIRELFLPIVGDTLGESSSFIDIAVTDYGVYACLDETKGRIFIYDYDGQMLGAFGGYGRTKGQFRKPTAVAWLGDRLVLTDTELRCAFVMKPTDFGDVALKASREYYNGRWDTATEYFQRCVDLNGNYEVAYIGLGKNALMQDRYEEAMYYFRLGNCRQYYSDAYNGYRGEQIRDHFWIVVIVFVTLITLLIVSEIRYHKKLGQKA